MDLQTFQVITDTVTAPVLFNYVWWVLTEAKKQGLRRLYFLARDGYVLEKIAQKFVSKFNLDIECRYLYCSRKSLRMPTYHLIGDETYRLLFLGGYHVSLSDILDRVELTQVERKEVLREVNLSSEDIDKKLTKFQLEAITNLLRRSEKLRTYVIEKSQQVYNNTIHYFEQEGLLDTLPFAIVDSGWTGSMQRSLRQLLESAGWRGVMHGFYFGMYEQPKEKRDGNYYCWYFSKTVRVQNRILFCNNVFECMLSAPHGMTVGYEQDEGNWKPVLMKPPVSTQLERIHFQISRIEHYAEEELRKIVFSNFQNEHQRKEAEQKLRRFMARPTKMEALAMGSFTFCDDITEGYGFPLADFSHVSELKHYNIFLRVCGHLFRKSSKQIERTELYWPYGVIALAESYKVWYFLNIYLWEWLRLIKK
ncbi:hypothetical protein [Faecalispora jeddahensis]|uniref:hypothetical protein n=1 Tax=Faecalispora jeddahensis TaxID=1414721 RepID=UPI0027B9D3BC|nr:hypothetical protein [Faecalispora jeddahensis]